MTELWKSDTNSLWANPEEVLRRAAEREDVVQGLVPLKGVTWLYGSSMSFKTFTAMSMAAAASCGRDWFGKKTQAGVVVYVGAEGGDALHIRRAAAELVAGASGDLYVVQDRPQIDSPEGLQKLRGVLNAFTGWWRQVSDLGVLSDRDEKALVQTAEQYGETETSEYSLLCVLDTYAQTAASDDRINVSAYIRNLRALVDEANAVGFDVTFVVVDHATKAGGSYIGSVAKLNDVDSQLELVREHGDNHATLYQRKTKDGADSAPLVVKTRVYEFEGYADAYGKPLSTLVVMDGTKDRAINTAAQGKSGLLLGLIDGAGGTMPDGAARGAFARHPEHSGVNKETTAKAYRRAKTRLVELGMVVEVEGELRRA